MRSVVGAALATLAALGVLALSGDARAQGDGAPPVTLNSVTLTWAAPNDCPTQGEMLDRIGRILGGAATARDPVVARVVVSPTEPGKYGAEVALSVLAQRDVRHLGGASCAEVSDAVALVIALAVNPLATEPARPARPSAPIVEAPPPATATERSRPVALGASALLDTSTLPSAAFGVEVAAGWNPRHFLVEGTFTYIPPRSARLATSPNEGADLALLRAGARACYELGGARLDVGPCAGAGLEFIQAHGFGAAQPHDATGRMVTGALGVRAIARILPWISLRLLAEGLAPIARPTFVIDNGGQVFHVAALLFRASAGVELHF